MKKFDLVSSFDTEKQHLSVGGFYPTHNIKYRYLYVASYIFNASLSWLQFISMATFAYINSSNLEKVSEILLFCMTQFAFLNKLTNFVLQKSNLRRLETMLQSNLLTETTQKETTILVNHVEEARALAKIYRVLCFLVVLFYALFPFLDDKSTKTHRFPLPCWFPFDESEYYYQVFFAEILSIAVGAWINSNIDILTVIMCVLATAEFEILSDRLAAILEPLDDSPDVEEAESVKMKLRDCVDQYDELLWKTYVAQYKLVVNKLRHFDTCIQQHCSLHCTDSTDSISFIVKSITILILQFSTIFLQTLSLQRTL